MPFGVKVSRSSGGRMHTGASVANCRLAGKVGGAPCSNTQQQQAGNHRYVYGCCCQYCCCCFCLTLCLSLHAPVQVCELSITLLYAMLLLLQRPPLGTAPPPPGTNQQQQQQDAQQQLGHGEQQGQAGHMPGTAASGAGGPEGCSAMAVGEESGLVAGDRAVLEHVLGQLQHTVVGVWAHE